MIIDGDAQDALAHAPPPRIPIFLCIRDAFAAD
jgi:hypothetical protein